MEIKKIKKYKIDKNIPIPIQVDYSVFPFEKMEIGDSFKVNLKDFSKTSCNQLRLFLYNRYKKFCFDTGSKKVFTFKEYRKEKYVRVFRIE